VTEMPRKAQVIPSETLLFASNIRTTCSLSRFYQGCFVQPLKFGSSIFWRSTHSSSSSVSRSPCSFWISFTLFSISSFVICDGHPLKHKKPASWRAILLLLINYIIRHNNDIITQWIKGIGQYYYLY